MALIGTRYWNPTGESMWGITAKIARRNHLDWAELRRLIGARGLKSFREPKEQDPGNPLNFQLPGLAISTGWDPAILSASFPAWYRPYWVSNDADVDPKYALNLARICPACAREGLHLVVHQLPNWIKCPLHRVPLTTDCPSCKKPLGAYRIRGPECDAGTCPHCRHFVLATKHHSSALLRQRLAFVGDYAAWMQAIRHAFSPDTHRRKWIEGPTLPSHLAHLHHIVPGPDWAEDCLVYGSAVRTRQWTWNGGAIDWGEYMRTYTLPSSARYFLNLRMRYKNAPPVIEDYSRLLSLRIRETGRRLKQEFGHSPYGDGVHELDAHSCLPQFGVGVSAWKTGCWFWRRCYDEAYPLRARWARTRTHYDLYESMTWRAWVNTVGRLLMFRRRHQRQPLNTLIVRWFTDFWLTRRCEEMYFQFVGIACRNIGHRWMNSFCLESETVGVGQTALWLLEENGNGATVTALSTIAPYDEFLALSRSGFRGSDADFCQSFDRLQPLIRLLRPHPSEVVRWKCLWSRVQQRAEQRRQSLR